jgi:tRNA threonylcarbamoyladenosine biosynthesis protein TsaE
MFISRSAEETVRFGCERAQTLRRGDVLALAGDLGAGKTQFVKGVVAGVGSVDEVTSPTFTLLNEYRGGRLPVFHFDFYRLETANEALRLGLDDYLFGEGVSVIEWPDRFPELIPETAEWIEFKANAAEHRSIELRRVA